MKQFPSASALTAASSIPSTLQASLILPAVHSFTLSHDTFDWRIDAKLKVGVVFVTTEQQVVSVTVKQHAEGRLQDSQSMLDRFVTQAPWTDESLFIPCHWRHGGLAFVFVCLAIRRIVSRRSLVVGRFLRWIPRALQQIYLGGNQGQGE